VGVYSGTPVICDTGNVDAWLEFSGFVSSPSANDFTIQALANAANQGFYFPENVNGPLSFEIGYDVEGFNETATSVTFHVTSSSQQQGQADVTMYLCPGFGLATDCINSPSQAVTLGPDAPIQTVSFDATPTLEILFVGNVDSTSSLTQFEATIGTGGTGSSGATGGVPEPATIFMVGFGLLVVAAILRRENAARRPLRTRGIFILYKGGGFLPFNRAGRL
jgi:hypothetical protein